MELVRAAGEEFLSGEERGKRNGSVARPPCDYFYSCIM